MQFQQLIFNPLRSRSFSFKTRSLSQKADLCVFSMLGQTEAPTKRGGIQVIECQTTVRHCLLCGCVTTFKFYFVPMQHIFGLNASEFRKPYFRSGNTAKAVASFCTLMSENLYGGFTLLPNRLQSF